MSDLPDGWLTDYEQAELEALAADAVVLELGAWKGRSTVVMARTAKLIVSIDRHQPFTHFGVDVHDDTLPIYLAGVRDLPNVVIVIGEFDVARLFDTNAFGLVFVDGVHDYDNVLADLSLANTFNYCTIAAHDWGRYDVAAAAHTLSMKPDRVVDSLAVFEP
jgi:predicted O-methyltransferase YrrM